MNLFTITFRNDKKELENVKFFLPFITVQGVKDWFDDNFKWSARSISKH